MARHITELVYNPAKETAKILDREGNEIISLSRTEALWLASQILKRFKYEIS